MPSLRPLIVISSIHLAMLVPAWATASGNAEGGSTEHDDRFAKKCAAGVLGGVGGGLLGAAIWVQIDDGSFGWELPALLGFWGGNLVGTPIGVSAVDPQDNLLITLAGSAIAGMGVPAATVLLSTGDSNGSETLFFLTAFLGPIVGATTASELSRNPPSRARHLEPDTPQILVTLVPACSGALSANVTLLF